jgi:hypothetical protein
MERGRVSSSTHARAGMRVDLPPGRRGRPRHSAGSATSDVTLVTQPPRYEARREEEGFVVFDTFIQEAAQFTRHDGGNVFETMSAATRAAATLNARYLEAVSA